MTKSFARAARAGGEKEARKGAAELLSRLAKQQGGWAVSGGSMKSRVSVWLAHWGRLDLFWVSTTH